MAGAVDDSTINIVVVIIIIMIIIITVSKAADKSNSTTAGRSPASIPIRIVYLTALCTRQSLTSGQSCMQIEAVAANQSFLSTQ